MTNKKKKKLTTAQAMRQLNKEQKKATGESVSAFKKRKGIRP